MLGNVRHGILAAHKWETDMARMSFDRPAGFTPKAEPKKAKKKPGPKPKAKKEAAKEDKGA